MARLTHSYLRSRNGSGAGRGSWPARCGSARPAEPRPVHSWRPHGGHDLGEVTSGQRQTQRSWDHGPQRGQVRSAADAALTRGSWPGERSRQVSGRRSAHTGVMARSGQVTSAGTTHTQRSRQDSRLGGMSSRVSRDTAVNGNGDPVNEGQVSFVCSPFPGRQQTGRFDRARGDKANGVNERGIGYREL